MTKSLEPRAMSHKFNKLFESGRIGGVGLKNRVVVAPMTRTSATDEGLATVQMARYYARFAQGGFAGVITEGTYIDEAFSQSYRGQPGIANEKQGAAWQRVVEAVHEYDTPIFMQLMHAGALSQYNRFTAVTVGPFARRPKGEQLPLYGGEGPYAVPLQLTAEDIQAVVENFANAAERAWRAGFDGIEIHGANGYLVDQFITDYSNRRRDVFGGSLRNRLQFPRMLIGAVKERVGSRVPVGIRLSQSKVNDFDYQWESPEAARTVFRAMVMAGADFIDLAAHDATTPVFGHSISFAALAKEAVSIPIIANGKLHDPLRAESFLASKQSDFVSVGKGALANRDWVRRVRSNQTLEEFDSNILKPTPTLDNEEKWWAARRRAA